MASDLMYIETDTQLPKRVDVVIVGAGIIGIATAYELTRKGLQVVVLDKGRVAAEQSSRNWGWVRKQNRDEREIPLIKYSLERWGEISTEINQDISFRRTGITYVSTDPKDVARWDEWCKMAAAYDLDSQMLGAKEANQKVPGTTKAWVGGVHSPTDGRAEPSRAVPLLTQASRQLGAKVIQHCAVRFIDTQNNTVCGVYTEKGYIKTSAVVCAAGAWASLFLKPVKHSFPQASVYSTALRTEPAKEITAGNISVPGVTLRRRLDGGYTLGLSGQGRVDITPQGIRYALKFLPTLQERRSGLKVSMGKTFWQGPQAWYRNWAPDKPSPFEISRDLDLHAEPSLVETATQVLTSTFPELKGIKIVEAWAGLIDNTPDAVPIISRVDQLSGLIISSGYSGHGFGIGLGAGRLTADLVTGDDCIVDPYEFRYARFFDGSKIQRPGMM